MVVLGGGAISYERGTPVPERVLPERVYGIRKLIIPYHNAAFFSKVATSVLRR